MPLINYYCWSYSRFLVRGGHLALALVVIVYLERVGPLQLLIFINWTSYFCCLLPAIYRLSSVVLRVSAKSLNS